MKRRATAGPHIQRSNHQAGVVQSVAATLDGAHRGVVDAGHTTHRIPKKRGNHTARRGTIKSPTSDLSRVVDAMMYEVGKFDYMTWGILGVATVVFGYFLLRGNLVRST